MFTSDTLSGFFDGFSPMTLFSPIGSLDSLLSGGENIWKGFTGQSSNEAINSENVAFQRENLDYQKALQQQIFDREDTSYQRTVQDMRSAGLSPLMMKSTNNAGSAIQTQAPQKQFEAINAIPLITSALGELNSLSVGQAQRDNINAQTRAINIENDYNMKINKMREFNYALDTFYKDIDLQDKSYNYNMKKITGYSENEFLNVMNMTRLAEGYEPIGFNSDLRKGNKGWTHTVESTGDLDFNYLIDNARKSLVKDFIKNLSVIKVGK